jgi:hypothetical protein
MTDEPSTKPRARRGSENRERQARVTFRVNQVEYRQIAAAASEAGLSLGSFCRSRLLVMPTTQPRRGAPVDVHALVRVQSELNRVAAYLHQLLRQGRLVKSEEVDASLRAYPEAIAALMAALVTTYGHRLPAPEPGEYGDEENEEVA